MAYLWVNHCLQQKRRKKPTRNEKVLGSLAFPGLIQLPQNGVADLESTLWNTTGTGFVVNNLKQAFHGSIEELFGGDSVLCVWRNGLCPGSCSLLLGSF
jgi:hypothetical protein